MENGIKRLPDREEELEKIAIMMDDWGNFFKEKCPVGCIHLVAWLSGMSSTTDGFSLLTAISLHKDLTSAIRFELEKKDAPLFNAIKMNVGKYGRWTEADVTRNNVDDNLTLHSLHDLEYDLRQPRAFRVSSELI